MTRKTYNVIEDSPARPRRGMKRLFGGFAALKVRITVGAFAALALGIGLTTALLVQQAERETLSAQRHRELAEAVRTANTLSQRLIDRQRALKATIAQLDEATLADDDRLAAFMESAPVLRGMFANVFAASPDGTIRVVADGKGLHRPVLNVAARDYFRLTLAEHRPIISEPLPGRISGEPVVIFTYPLQAAGKIYGVFGGALRLTSRDILEDLVGDDDAGAQANAALVVVTDAHGRILAHPNRARVLQTLSTEPRLSQAFERWVATGSPVEPEGLHLPQASEVVSTGGVAGPDWVVWRALPEAQLLAPLRDARKQALAWAAGLIAVMSLATFALLHKLLRPLTQLEHRARRLFDGTLEAHTGWPEASGEIGALARVLRHVGAERAQLETFNTQVLQKLGSVMSAAPVGICFTRDQRFELVSAEFCRMFGRAEHEFLGQPPQMIYASHADYLALGPRVGQAFARGEPYEGEWEMLRADGTPFWARLRGRPVDVADRHAGTIWTLDDIGDHVAARTQLEWAASHDVLTGLANRKMLDQRLAAVFDVLPRSLPAALVMIDLDHFKPINDSAGHAAGDAMLKAVASAITSRVRVTDLVVRIGGDEFALLLERCAPEVALRIADSVLGAVNDIALHWEQRTLRVGASLGLASLAAETRDAAAWMQAADAACYRAKASGRGTVCVAVRPLLTPTGDSLMADD
jgi:diguanylate cyclase (GGDEF)-like protein/PAS domain S-box-containing protein